MAYSSPNGYRPYPAYSAGYTPLSQPMLWPTTRPLAASNAYAPLTPLRYAQPAPLSYARPAVSTGGGHWYSSLMNPPQSPQSMVISLNAPKLTSKEARQNFWLKVGGTTLSIVSGLGIFAYFGMKILPRKIVQEMGSQAHKALLNSLTAKTMETLLTDIKNDKLIEDAEILKAVKAKWCHRNPQELYRNKKDFAQFKAEVEPHISHGDLLALFGQDVVRNTATDEVVSDITNQLIDAGKDAIETRILNDSAYMRKVGNKVQETTAQAFNQEFKDAQIQGLMSSLKKQLLNPEQQLKAMESTSVKAALEKKPAVVLQNADQKRTFALEHINIEDAINIVGATAKNNLLNPQFITDLVTEFKKGMIRQIPGIGRWFAGAC